MTGVRNRRPLSADDSDGHSITPGSVAGAVVGGPETVRQQVKTPLFTRDGGGRADLHVGSVKPCSDSDGLKRRNARGHARWRGASRCDSALSVRAPASRTPAAK